MAQHTRSRMAGAVGKLCAAASKGTKKAHARRRQTTNDRRIRGGDMGPHELMRRGDKGPGKVEKLPMTSMKDSTSSSSLISLMAISCS